MRKTLITPLLFIAFVACDNSDDLLGYDAETGAAYLALSDGLPPEPNIPEKDGVWEDAWLTQDEADDASVSLACDAPLMRDRFLKIRDRLEDEDFNLPPMARGEHDADENGTERIDHRRRMRHGILKHLMFVYDVNGDRLLDEQERETVLADLDARCVNVTAKILDRFDGNEDGVLDQEERAAAKTAWRAKKDARRATFRERVDLNGDGELSRDEKRAAFAKRRAKYQKIRKNLQKRFDANEDGVLDDAEKTELRTFLRQKIRLDVPPAAGELQ